MITGHGGTDQRLWCFVNAEESDIAAESLLAAAANAVEENEEITAPENTTHVVCNFDAAYTAMVKRHIANGDGLYDEMREAVGLVITLDGLESDLADLQDRQLTIESTFSTAMGDMLRDGYWADNNYAPGQEEYLYQDALDVMEQMAKPTVTYTLSQVGLSAAMGFDEPFPEINDKVNIWDEDLKLKDVVYVSKQTLYLDKSQQDTVDVTNEDPALSGQSFESIMSRISQLADLVNQKNTLYERAGAITASGTIYADRLNGMIDVRKNRLGSVISNWYTDDSGAIVFESATGDSAMMLTGGGWMIADGKTQDGDWNWRTAADGKGIVADRITVGYLSADRIEAGTITTNKLSSAVGSELDIRGNAALLIYATEDGTRPAGALFTPAASGDSYIRIGPKNGNNPAYIDIATGGLLNLNGATINIASQNTIQIQSQGSLSLESGGNVTIGNSGSPFTIGSNGTNAFIYNGMTSFQDETHEGVYVGTDGIALGQGLFKVTKAGALTAMSADISGRITAAEGEIGGFTIAGQRDQQDTTWIRQYIYNGTNSIDSTVGGVYIGTDGLNLGGKLKYNKAAGSLAVNVNSFNLEADGSISIFSNDDSSHIYFGGTEEEPNFALGNGGDITARSVTAESLTAQASNLCMPLEGSLAKDFFCGSASDVPAGKHNYILLEPSSISSVGFYKNFGDDAPSFGQNTTQVTTFERQGSPLANGTCQCGVYFRLYYYGTPNSTQITSIQVHIRKVGDTGTGTLIYSGSSGTLYSGSYFTVDTRNNPETITFVDDASNLTKQTAIEVVISVARTNSYGMRMAKYENFSVNFSNNSSTGRQSCSVYYVP